MSVRRTAPPEVQPKEFSFTAKNLAWAKEQIAKYPEGRQASAIIPLMWRAQEQHHGWLPEAAIRTIARRIPAFGAIASAQRNAPNTNPTAAGVRASCPKQKR